MLIENNYNATTFTKDNSCDLNGIKLRIQIRVIEINHKNSRFLTILEWKANEWCILFQRKEEPNSI